MYEKKRENSLAIMQDTAKKRKKIVESIMYMDERLHELEEEKQELQEFRLLDKRRRVLEFSLYNSEMEESDAQLAALEAQRAEHMLTSNQHIDTQAHLVESLEALERGHRADEQLLRRYQREAEEVEEERADLLKAHVKAELRVKDALERSSTKEERNERRREEIHSFEAKLQETKHILETQVQVAFESAREVHEGLAQETARVGTPQGGAASEAGAYSTVRHETSSRRLLARGDPRCECCLGGATGGSPAGPATEGRVGLCHDRSTTRTG